MHGSVYFKGKRFVHMCKYLHELRVSENTTIKVKSHPHYTTSIYYIHWILFKTVKYSEVTLPYF